MITDNIENLKLYGFGTDIIDFIENIRRNPKFGKHIINDKVYANVETYKTKKLSDAKFEAHQNYIDIQILLKGREKIYYTSKDNLDVKIPYNEEKDIVFYSQNIENYPWVGLDGSNFVVLKPHEAHAPQVCDEFEQDVVKLVVKVKAD